MAEESARKQQHPEELEYQYTPSLWTDRFPTREEVLEHHITFIKKVSGEIRATIPWVTRSYGSSSRQAIDIYGTDLEDGSPILIYIHGGFWQELSKEESCYPVLPLYKRGVKTAIIDYDLCPTVTLDVLVEQAIQAVKEVLAYAENSSTRFVCVSGHSAGGHLAAMAIDAIRHPLIAGAALISGLYDLVPIAATSNWSAIGIDNEEEIRRLSPIRRNFIELKDVNILIAVGGKESAEFKSQSKRMQTHFQENDINAKYTEESQDDHFSIVEKLSETNNFLTEFMMMIIK